MVSSYVYDICKEYLDKFLFDFDRSQLSMSILSGNITLRDINLRPDEINDFLALNKVPLTVRAGFASKMSLTFSVISFHSSPIEIEFDDLSLICGPSLHQMSNDTSFVMRRGPAMSSRSMAGADYDDESQSSYDSTNAFDVHQYGLKDPSQQKSTRPNPAVLTQDDPFAHLAKHKTWKEHQKFLQRLKVAKVMESGRQNHDFDFDVDVMNDPQAEEYTGRSILNQLQVTVNGLHIRFEEDYFSADRPYSIGLVADKVTFYSAAQGAEMWTFPDFLQSIFHTRPANDPSSYAAAQAAAQAGDLIFKDAQIQNCQVYINSQSEIYVPTQLYEECKHLPMQIFEKLSPQHLSQLMTSKKKSYNYILEPVDLMANFGDARGNSFSLNIITGKISLKISEPVLSTIFTFVNYIENHTIIRRLKQYRPQRKPLTDSALAQGKYHGQDVQELPENIRRKRKLLVRDWFNYVLWYVRLRNVERKKPTACDRLCKAQLAHDPDRYRDLIRAAAGGTQAMKDWLAKEEHVKRLEQKERNELHGEFPLKDYKQVIISCRLETLHIQLYERAIQVGFGLPLYDLSCTTIAYEKKLEKERKKLASRLAVGQITLKQVHTFDIETQQQFNNSRPVSQRGSMANRPKNSLLSQILNNERKMNQLSNAPNARQSPSRRPGSLHHTASMTSQTTQLQTGLSRLMQVPTQNNHQSDEKRSRNQHQVVTEPSRDGNGPSNFMGLIGSLLGNNSVQSSQPEVDHSNSRPITAQSFAPTAPGVASAKPSLVQASSIVPVKTQTIPATSFISTGPPKPQLGPATSRHKGMNLSAALSSRYNNSTANVGSRPGKPQMAMASARQQPQIGRQGLERPKIIHQTQNITTRAPMPMRLRDQNNPSCSSPIRQEEMLPRGSRFLTLIEVKPPRLTSQEHLQSGGLANCCLDVLHEVPRFSQLDRLAPLQCLPSSLVSLQRHIKVGILTSTELHTEQLLEAVTKLFTNYSWCIEEIRATPSIFEALFSYDPTDFDELFNNAMHLHVIKNYLGSSKADRDGQFKKKTKMQRVLHKQQRSMNSDGSQIGDGVTTFANVANSYSMGINMPRLGANQSMARLDRAGDHFSEEENLTDDAIKEIDPERQRINSASRAHSPNNFNQPYSPRDMRQQAAERERINLVTESPLLRAMIELLPRTPVDFRVLLAVHEARIAMFSNHVPVMRTNVTAPIQVCVNKESQMSSFQVGSLQSYFMSEPEMLFSFARTLNAHLEAVFSTEMLRKERNLQKLRALIQDSRKTKQKAKKRQRRASPVFQQDDEESSRVNGRAYNQLFQNLADNTLTESQINLNNTSRNHDMSSRLQSSQNKVVASPATHKAIIAYQQDDLPPTTKASMIRSPSIPNTESATPNESPRQFIVAQNKPQQEVPQLHIKNIFNRKQQQVMQPLSDLAQNKRGALQKEQQMKQEESKRALPQQQQQKAAGLKKLATMSSETLGNEEEDLDEKCSSSANLFGYDAKKSQQYQQQQHRYEPKNYQPLSNLIGGTERARLPRPSAHGPAERNMQNNRDVFTRRNQTNQARQFNHQRTQQSISNSSQNQNIQRAENDPRFTT